MADTGGLTWPVQRGDNFLRIVVYITLATAFIFLFDTLTPLGLVNWILYLIPLFLTVYLSWKYAPFVMTGVFVVLMVVSLFLSPRDVSLELALLNRIFFAMILVIASFFIRDYVSNVEGLARSEERFRHLIEWLPEGVIIYRQEKVVYINPAGARVLGIDGQENLIGRDIIDLIDPAWQAIFRERVAQACLGAQMNIDKVRIIRSDKSEMNVGMSLGATFWDRQKAVQIIIKNR